MKRKRVLFILTYFDCGGICRSLQNYLNLYDEAKYEIDVFAMVHDGMFCGEFKKCRILKKDNVIHALISRYGHVKGVRRIQCALIKALRKLFGVSFQDFLFKRAGNHLLSHSKYDTVVAFSEGVPSRFVSFMKHSNKVAWIHCDYSSYVKGLSKPDERFVYNKFQRIVCVSSYTKDIFVEYYPELCGRTTFIYNIQDSEMMKSMACQTETPLFDKGSFNIVSVGRIDPVKRFSIIPRIASEVKKLCMEANVTINWYIIGPKGGAPNEYNSLINNIKKYRVEDAVNLIGEKSNPYYHIGHADLLVNTSVSEACPYVINEAKILGTPCVCANFGSAKEFIQDGINGYVVPVEQMSKIIFSLILNKELYDSLKLRLSSYNYDNRILLSQYEEVLQ